MKKMRGWRGDNGGLNLKIDRKKYKRDENVGIN